MSARRVCTSAASGALVLGLVGAFILLVASPALAGGPETAVPVGPIEWLFHAMRTAVMSWQRTGQEWARTLFIALAGLNLSWLGVQVLTSGAFDLKGGVLRFARELFVLSLFYALIELGPELATELVQFFERAGEAAAGGSLRPTQQVLDKTIETTVALVKDHGGSLLGLESIWLGLCSVAIMLCVALIAAVMWIVELFTYVTIGVGAILLGGGGAIWTRFLVTNYLKFAAGSGIALYFLRFTQNFVLAHLESWAAEAKAPAAAGWLSAAMNGAAGLGPETMFTMLATVAIEAVLVVLAPALALGLLGGGLSNIADAVGLQAGRAAQSGGIGHGLRAAAGAASSAASTVKNAVTGAAAGRSGNGPGAIAKSGGAKPAVGTSSRQAATGPTPAAGGAAGPSETTAGRDGAGGEAETRDGARPATEGEGRTVARQAGSEPTARAGEGSGEGAPARDVAGAGGAHQAVTSGSAGATTARNAASVGSRPSAARSSWVAGEAGGAAGRAGTAGAAAAAGVGRDGQPGRNSGTVAGGAGDRSESSSSSGTGTPASRGRVAAQNVTPAAGGRPGGNAGSVPPGAAMRAPGGAEGGARGASRSSPSAAATPLRGGGPASPSASAPGATPAAPSSTAPSMQEGSSSPRVAAQRPGLPVQPPSGKTPARGGQSARQEGGVKRG